ncbi:peptidoglycan DD-metalloendopeptidase family protein [Nakamurella sp. YIM 132087]|uniref:Peptidoglycan DD-metalloendopeptidase family protein n=2 Tax=Nakamurella alba TaxID=2665158 RepID=A0A7K1FER9_9ACTN|nr:peptidoglycan DD-metalloendopeptidase family protein [Nakamurella alba]
MLSGAVSSGAGSSGTGSPTTGSSTSTEGSSTSGAQPGSGGNPIADELPVAFTPITGRVVAAPEPVPATDGMIHLVYELQLINVLAQDVRLDSVAVRGDGEDLLELAADDLPSWMRVFGATEPGTTTFGPGQAGLVWLDVTLEPDQQVPARLDHVITATPTTPSEPLIPATLTETIAATEVSTAEPVEVLPPLRGPGWVDGGSCCALTAHRGAVNSISGEFFAAERFAIDYVQVDSEGRLWSGDATSVDSYPYFGTGVYAVADGPVVAVVDGMPEQTPTVNPTGLELAEYGGNHIVQDIGNGRYAFYAHLKTGTAGAWKVGDQLTAGEQIAELGNTGNTDAPHLHFHIMDSPDPLRANGLPFVLDEFEVEGRYPSEDALGPLLEDGGPVPTEPGIARSTQRAAMPLSLDIMTYPGG